MTNITAMTDSAFSSRSTTARANARTNPGNEKLVHGIRITRDLHEAEAALDEALIRQANLLATMVRARRSTAVGPFTGQEALLRLAASQKAMLQASGELARVHGKLLEVSHEVKSGLADDCPPAGSIGENDTPAALVQAA